MPPGTLPVEATWAVLVLVSAGSGYLIGSFSAGYVVGRLYKDVDLRSLGSGSTGATNTARNLGLGAGAMVATLDVAKGAVAVWLVQLVAPSGEARMVMQAVAAVAVVAGHCWPITLGQGGRGIAPGVGALAFIASPALLFGAVFFFGSIALTRIVSVGSLTAVVGVVGGYVVLIAAGLLSFHWASLGFLLLGGAIVYVRHLGNIRRLLAGREPRIGDPARS